MTRAAWRWGCWCGCRTWPRYIDDEDCRRWAVPITDPEKHEHTGSFIWTEAGLSMVSLREARGWAA